MQEFKDFLTEGVYDKHIFKAFFLAGGPGSGKSWVAARTLEGSGLKLINTDLGLENYARKVGLELKMTAMSDFQTRQKDFLRKRSKKGTESQLAHAIDGRLGLILDSTARDVPRIEREMRALQVIGYDTYMVFVNTTIEVALKRNQLRPRSLPDHLVKSSHKQIQANKAQLKQIFGSSNYEEVDNNYDLKYINNQVYKAINKHKKKKYSKQKAKDWYDNEIAMKKATGAAATKKKGFLSFLRR